LYLPTCYSIMYTNMRMCVQIISHNEYHVCGCYDFFNFTIILYPLCHYHRSDCCKWWLQWAYFCTRSPWSKMFGHAIDLLLLNKNCVKPQHYEWCTNIWQWYKPFLTTKYNNLYYIYSSCPILPRSTIHIE